jgi:hypothetical protein
MKRILLVFLFLILIFSVSCKKLENLLNPEDHTGITETPELKAITKSFEDALIQKDSVKLKTLILPQYLNDYNATLNSGGDKLASLGEIFKTRKLVLLDKIYAVYVVTYNNTQYEITFGWDNDGNWKLMNF